MQSHDSLATRSLCSHNSEAPVRSRQGQTVGEVRVWAAVNNRRADKPGKRQNPKPVTVNIYKGSNHLDHFDTDENV